MNATEAHSTLERKPLAWATWRATVCLTLVVLVARVAFLVLFSPLELTGDEAHYWEWSRRLDLSYYSKGPGVAWTIWAATQLFGHTEWAVRLGAALSGAVTMLALGRLGTDCSDGDARVGFFAALAFALAPGFQGMNLLMTIDGPYLMCWALASWAAWHVTQRLEQGRSAFGPMAGLAAALGVGFLYKYTILLLIPGLLIYLVMRRKHVRLTRGNLLGVVVAMAVFVVAISPVIIWNAREGWPTVKHLIGAIGLPGGDMPVSTDDGPAYSPMWTLELIGAQIGLMGPPLFVLIVASVMWALRHRDRPAPHGWATDLLLLCIGMPVLVFYLLISFVHETQGNWPVAGFVTLLVLVARRVVVELPRYDALVRDWLAMPAEQRPKMGLLRKKPETLWQVAWHWSVAVGVIGVLGVVGLSVAGSIPQLKGTKLIGRLRGTEAFVREITPEIEALSAKTGEEPLLIADRYGEASLLAFYLPGNPRVYCAQHYMGRRKSQYDYFADTDLEDESIVGRPAVLFRESPGYWDRSIRYDDREPITLPPSDTRAQRWAQDYFTIRRYLGVHAPNENAKP